MKLVIDMNLSPRWCDRLAENGHDAVHWFNQGDPGATDATIMAWAAEQARVVLTHDLDFGLAASGAHSPSVVQDRADDVSPEAIGSEVARALHQMAAELDAGALMTIEPGCARVTLLPIRSPSHG